SETTSQPQTAPAPAETTPLSAGTANRTMPGSQPTPKNTTPKLRDSNPSRKAKTLLLSYIRSYQVNCGENKKPDDINEVPVQSHGPDGLRAASFVITRQAEPQRDEQAYQARAHMQPVKPGQCKK